MVKPVKMDKSTLVIIKYVFYDLMKNNFSKAGCRWLSKANWKSLITIRLCKNQII
jgi:hypothetical protein